VLAGRGSGLTYIPGRAGGYRSAVLDTEQDQLMLGRVVCETAVPLGHWGLDEVEAALE